eukprot:gene3347-4094_t
MGGGRGRCPAAAAGRPLPGDRPCGIRDLAEALKENTSVTDLERR